MIYRTTSFVNVPAGGKTDVEVVADESGERGNISPDRFEIVALWPGLKDSIFGTSAQPLSGGIRSAQAVTQALIDDATNLLMDNLRQQATQATIDVPPDMTVVGDPTVISSSIHATAKAGATVQSFTVQGTVATARIAVDTASLKAQTASMLSTALRAGEELVSTPEIAVRIENANATANTADLELTASGTAKLNTTSNLFSAVNFTRKTPADIVAALKGIPGVKNAEVHISPFWLKKTPSLSGQIRVTIVAQ
jgi:hypothetical protein